jgi:hypothetical protein
MSKGGAAAQYRTEAALAIAPWWNQEKTTDADSEEGAGAAVEAELAVIEDALGLSGRATKFWTRSLRVFPSSAVLACILYTPPRVIRASFRIVQE